MCFSLSSKSAVIFFFFKENQELAFHPVEKQRESRLTKPPWVESHLSATSGQETGLTPWWNIFNKLSKELGSVNDYIMHKAKKNNASKDA